MCDARLNRPIEGAKMGGAERHPCRNAGLSDRVMSVGGNPSILYHDSMFTIRPEAAKEMRQATHVSGFGSFARCDELLCADI